MRGLRAANSTLHNTRPSLHSKQAFDAVDDAISRLEDSIRGLQEHQKVQMVFSWLESLEKNNQPLYNLILKTYLDAQTPIKWANSVFKKDTPPEEPLQPIFQHMKTMPTEAQELVNRLRKQVPELESYHVVLVPKSPGHGSDDTSDDRAPPAT